MADQNQIEVARVKKSGATLRQHVGVETIGGREVSMGQGRVYSEGDVIKGLDPDLVQLAKDGDERANSLIEVLSGKDAQEAWDEAVDNGQAFPSMERDQSLGTAADRPQPGLPGQVGLQVEEFDPLEASDDEVQEYLAKAPQSEQIRVLAILNGKDGVQPTSAEVAEAIGVPEDVSGAGEGEVVEDDESSSKKSGGSKAKA